MRSYSRPPLEAALSISNLNSFNKGQFFEKELIKTNKLSSMSNNKLPKIVCLEQIFSAVQ